jgi:FAD/FMN-containing dehydrogenase
MMHGIPGSPRRAILLGGAAIAAGSFGRRLGASGTPDWAALRRQLSTHELSLPGERSYPRARLLFDPRFDYLRPAGIAYCAVPADVSACLSFAQRYRLPVRARSGGHSYAGWSSVTGGLVIDVTPMNHFVVGTGTVTAGAGLDLITLYDRLAAHGLAIPGGSCPTVGLAGLALGGGIGVLARQFGLTCDHLVAVQLVTADGSVLTCDSTRHADLAWACRGGGGGNFGVATSFTLRTHRLTELVLFFLSWPWSQASRVISAWQSWAPHGPGALWSNLHVGAAFGGPPRITVGGTYTGSTAATTQALGDLYARIGSGPATSFVSTESYRNAMLIEAGCAGLTVTECDTGPGGRLPRVPSFAKSDFFTARLSASAIGALIAGVERLGGIVGAGGGAGSIAFDALGGAVNRVPSDATAFVHRNALFGAQYYTSWNSPGSATGIARQHEWLRSVYASLHPHASGQAYQNYIDPDLVDWRRAYYGANYARLSEVKARYDPSRVFRFPQAITPPTAARLSAQH